jgi:hypothetical protein
MSTETRLKRLGLLHLKDRPAALARALKAQQQADQQRVEKRLAKRPPPKK